MSEGNIEGINKNGPRKRISMADTVDKRKTIKLEPKTFYITPEQSKQLALEKAHTGKDLSTIVREAITDYFKKAEVDK